VEPAVSNRQRVAWVDCCKGICIVLVVYGHGAGGLEAAGVLTSDSVFAALREWVYIFHIPAFFFLSGLFALKASERPFLQFLQGRLRVLGYPYVVWTVIVLVSQFVMGRLVNSPPSTSRAIRFLWEPYGVGLWFLYSLFLISLLFTCMKRLRIPPIPMLLISVALYLLAQHNTFRFWTALNASMAFAVFFVIGGCYPGIIAAPFEKARWPLLTAASAGLFTLMTLGQLVPPDPIGFVKLIRALLGIGGVVCLAMALARTAAAGPWALLGAYSLEIYLAHPLWGTASRAVLLRCGVHVPQVFVACGVAFGVFGSLALALLCKRFDFPYLFRWPTEGAAARANGRPPTRPD
jgi:fucose 4-O-acetylase-like acetyltransferase